MRVMVAVLIPALLFQFGYSQEKKNPKKENSHVAEFLTEVCEAYTGHLDVQRKKVKESILKEREKIVRNLIRAEVEKVIKDRSQANTVVQEILKEVERKRGMIGEALKSDVFTKAVQREFMASELIRLRDPASEHLRDALELEAEKNRQILKREFSYFDERELEEPQGIIGSEVEYAKRQPNGREETKATIKVIFAPPAKKAIVIEVEDKLLGLWATAARDPWVGFKARDNRIAVESPALKKLLDEYEELYMKAAECSSDDGFNRARYDGIIKRVDDDVVRPTDGESSNKSKAGDAK